MYYSAYLRSMQIFGLYNIQLMANQCNDTQMSMPYGHGPTLTQLCRRQLELFIVSIVYLYCITNTNTYNMRIPN